MRTDHTFEPHAPISASSRVFVAHHVRRIAENMRCSDIAVQRAVKQAQATLSRTGDRIEAVSEGCRFAVTADIAARRESAVLPKTNWVLVLKFVVGLGLIAGACRVIWLVVAP